MTTYKWYEFKANEAQVIWFRKDGAPNGLSVLYENGKWEYDNIGNFGMNPNDYREPTRQVPNSILRKILKDLFRNLGKYLQ